MGVTKRTYRDGTTAYTAQIRIKKDGVIVHKESATFERKPVANAWHKDRLAELRVHGIKPKVDDPTLADVIDKYNADKQQEHGKTKTQVLRTIKKSNFALLRCSEIKSSSIIAYAKTITAKPQTVGNYLSHLAAIFAVARPAWGYPLAEQEMRDAAVVAKRLGLTARSAERDRRPSLDELRRLMTYYALQERKRPKSFTPMRKIIWFAIFSTRRQEEITRMVWEDLDRKNMEFVVRDMKHPGEKIGNDVRTALLPQALEVIDSLAGRKGKIFPFSAESISTSFRRACAFLEIEDLHFHDLRHDGISRLFELGWTIPRAATVSGHRSWKSLQRYTQYRQDGDRYEGWRLADWVSA